MSGSKNLRIDFWLTFFVFLFLSVSAIAQPSEFPNELNLIFYNTENLFDVQDDPATLDDEFLPQGERHWSTRRYEDKLNRLSKVILASCGFQLPDIVGVCEVENRQVLESLVGKTPLAKFNYQLIHKDSPDERGIDVAMLYRTDNLLPLEYDYLPLVDVNGAIVKTREILHVCFQVANSDTIHVFINHWPSRYIGQAETEDLRILAARTVRKAVEEIYAKETTPLIVIMGDFNDQSQNRSIRDNLMAQNNESDIPVDLVNLSSGWSPKGTLKHQQSWQVFDQIIVSDYLLQNKKIMTSSADATIIELPFLFEPDPKFKGKRLFRTYSGFKYQGGFSDHLPVRLKLTLTN